jgi:hypothetical protein
VDRIAASRAVSPAASSSLRSLLERLSALLEADTHYSFTDAWGAKLCEEEPRSQLGGCAMLPRELGSQCGGPSFAACGAGLPPVEPARPRQLVRFVDGFFRMLALFSKVRENPSTIYSFFRKNRQD